MRISGGAKRGTKLVLQANFNFLQNVGPVGITPSISSHVMSL